MTRLYQNLKQVKKKNLPSNLKEKKMDMQTKYVDKQLIRHKYPFLKPKGKTMIE